MCRCIFNSNANPTKKKEKDGPGYEQLGNKTECALLEFMIKLGLDYQVLRQQDKVALHSRSCCSSPFLPPKRRCSQS